MEEEFPELIKIHGIVLPIEWDKQGNIQSICISTFDEEEYLVEKDKTGRQLMYYIRKEVDISGTLHIKKDNTKKIIVKEFSLKNL